MYEIIPGVEVSYSCFEDDEENIQGVEQQWHWAILFKYNSRF